MQFTRTERIKAGLKHNEVVVSVAVSQEHRYMAVGTSFDRVGVALMPLEPDGEMPELTFTDDCDNYCPEQMYWVGLTLVVLNQHGHLYRFDLREKPKPNVVGRPA